MKAENFDIPELPQMYYIEKKIHEDLCCPVSLQPLEDPVMHVNCGNLFSKRSLVPLTTCPLCRGPLTDVVKSPNMIRNLVNNLIVRCSRCSTEMRKELFMDHAKKSCTFDCLRECGEKVTHDTVEAHLSIECDMKEVPCSAAEVGCTTIVTRRELAAHEAHCNFVEFSPFLSAYKAQLGELENQKKDAITRCTMLLGRIKHVEEALREEEKLKEEALSRLANVEKKLAELEVFTKEPAGCGCKVISLTIIPKKTEKKFSFTSSKGWNIEEQEKFFVKKKYAESFPRIVKVYNSGTSGDIIKQLETSYAHWTVCPSGFEYKRAPYGGAAQLSRAQPLQKFNLKDGQTLQFSITHLKYEKTTTEPTKSTMRSTTKYSKSKEFETIIGHQTYYDSKGPCGYMSCGSFDTRNKHFEGSNCSCCGVLLCRKHICSCNSCRNDDHRDDPWGDYMRGYCPAHVSKCSYSDCYNSYCENHVSGGKKDRYDPVWREERYQKKEYFAQCPNCKKKYCSKHLSKSLRGEHCINCS